jgi:hypothetical protein
MLSWLLLSALQTPLDPQAESLIRLPAQAYVNLSPAEGWTIQLSAPVILSGQGFVPTAGIHFGKTFALGKALGWQDWAERVGLGVGAGVFAPLNFQQLYLNAGVGLSHSTPPADIWLDYGLRYAPLIAIDWAANTSTGYNGLLANLGLHFKLQPNTWTTLGLQGGFYYPFTGAGREPIWVLQPLAGVNAAF